MATEDKKKVILDKINKICKKNGKKRKKVVANQRKKFTYFMIWEFFNPYSIFESFDSRLFQSKQNRIAFFFLFLFHPKQYFE